MIELLRAVLVPNGSVEVFHIRFFVVALHHGIQGEAAEANAGLNSGTLIARIL